MKKETKQLLFLFTLIGIGLIYFYINYLFMPQWSNIKQLEEINAERKSYHELLLTYESNSTTLQKELDTVQLAYSDLMEQIPQKIDKPELVISLYNEAKVNQVQPETVVFGTLETRDGYLVQPITFICLGGSQNVFQMINTLQNNSAYKFALDSVNFTNQGDLLRGEMQLLAYAISREN